jgi:hypothetical protein
MFSVPSAFAQENVKAGNCDPARLHRRREGVSDRGRRRLPRVVADSDCGGRRLQRVVAVFRRRGGKLPLSVPFGPSAQRAMTWSRSIGFASRCPLFLAP